MGKERTLPGWSTKSDWKYSVELVIGLWLLASPLVLGFFSTPTASMTAVAIATVVFFVSQLGIVKRRPWEEWMILVAAVILIASPWLFGYVSVIAATWNAVAAGGLLVLLAVLQIIEEYGAIKHKAMH